MMKNAKRFLSMLLAVSMVFGLLVFPTSATENHNHEHNEEANTVSTKNDIDVEANVTVVPLKTEGVEVDEEDPAIIAVTKELDDMLVLNAEGDPVPLTEEQKQQILYLFQQYLDQWEANAHLLGVQVPFFLQYNDKGEDGLGILGEMLAMAGATVDVVRAGYMTFDDLSGMIMNFYYGDQLGLQYYGNAIASKRDEVLKLINNSGSKTDVQKLLVLNDWLAHNVTFDMPYIMNTDKEPGEEPMVAADPQPHEHYDDVYDVMYQVYEQQIRDTFEGQIRDGLEAEFKYQYYYEAIKAVLTDMYTAGAIQEAAKDEQIIAAVKDAYWQQYYENAKTELMDSEVYDNAYQAEFDSYLDENCTHELSAAAFVWTAVLDEEGKETGTWTATADVTCAICDRLFDDVAAITENKKVEATCTEPEATVCVATVTVGEFTATEVKVLSTVGEALGHTWDEGTVTKEPTETEKGEKTFTCTVCGETKTEEIDVLEHVHNYIGVVTTEPTCVAEGVKTFTCTCGEGTYTEAIPMVEHTWDEGTVTKEPTETETGIKTYTCAVCEGTKEEVLPVLEHVHNYTSVVTEPTCTEAGFTTYTCACGDTYTADEVDALGHDYRYDVTKEATCGEVGYQNVTCTRCDYYVQAEEIPATGEHVPNQIEPEYCDICGQLIPVEGEDEGEEPVNATEEGEAIREKADGAAKVAAEAAVESAANAAADEAVAALTEEEIASMAQEAVKSNPDAMAAIDAEVAKQVEAFMTENNDAIKADPVGFVDSMELLQTEVPVTDAEGNYIIGEDGNPVMMTIAQQLHAGWDQFWADAQENGIEVDPVNAPGYKMTVDQIVAQQMDTAMDDLPEKPDGTHMTPNEAIPVFADQAAVGLTDGVLNYWQGSHIGALGRGTAVCLGYTKAFTYLVQYMNPAIYGVNGANTDMSKAANWKTADQLYYDANGNLDINANYVVDDVRITFDANVTMYGETQENFNSDHFWNAVKVDGKWYYADPCYTDVYTEVMMRDRVETDGSMNHMYFIFSDTTARELYDGNYSEIKTLYEGVSSHTDFEDSWISRIKSNTYFDGGYAYYLYDSTDLITLMQDANSENNNASDLMNQEYLYKIVRHKLTDKDNGNDGDTSYEALIEFNYKADEDDEESVARVYNGTKMVENVLLTKLYAQHEAEREIYPSIALTCALYNGKIYFNISNVIASYDLSTYEVEIVKEYNTVYGLRDDTNPFGGMAFSVSNANNYDFAIENHPIAAMTIKPDGNMYVSVATNFAFISGKDPHNSEDQSSYGYEFEESNYNAAYNSYQNDQYGDMDYEQFGYEKETNDNDEFMWSANFVETLSMSHLAGTRHDYAEVTVPATCGRNAYTENRCSTCGASEPDTRVEIADTALTHHFVEFEETYYTKANGNSGNWNTGRVYVCTVCGFHIEEPTEPDPDADYSMTGTTYEEQKAIYDEQKAIYDEAVATAGHTYEATDAVWADDNSTVTFSILECSNVCPEKQPYLDCLLQDDTIKLTLPEKVVAETTIIDTIGTCPEGLIQIYQAAGEVEVEIIKGKPEMVEYSFTKEVQQAAKNCDFSTGICPVCGDSQVKRLSGKSRVETAIKGAEQLKAALKVESFDAIILASGKNFADALAGSYLANAEDAPILLHFGDSTAANLEYIQNNLSEDGIVYILGGAAAVPEEVEAALTDAGLKVERVKGKTRFDTNLAIIEKAGITNEEILVATGWNFADCLSVSATGLPILMVDAKTNTLTESQVEFLTKYAKNKVTIIGGTGAVSAELEAAIAEIVEGDIERVYGKGREATSVAVAQKYFKAPTFAVIAYSRNFPDGLCGGPLAYAMGAPLLLTDAGYEDVTAEYITANKIVAGYIMGGSAALSDETAKVCFGITSELEIPKI